MTVVIFKEKLMEVPRENKFAETLPFCNNIKLSLPSNPNRTFHMQIQ